MKLDSRTPCFLPKRCSVTEVGVFIVARVLCVQVGRIQSVSGDGLEILAVV